MTITLRIPSVRSMALLFAGLMLGALISNPAPATGLTTYTRAASCHGLNFHPINNATGFKWHATEKYLYYYHTETSSGDGYFLCDPALPHKAVVTKVQFTLMDDDNMGEIRYCALYRQSLADTYPTPQPQLMAQVTGTGVAAEPGKVRPSTTSITFATVDNTQFGYYLQCQPTKIFGKMGIYGAVVTYKITAANG